MNRSVGPLKAAMVSPAPALTLTRRAADSSVRTLVVPTAMIRPPASPGRVDRGGGFGGHLAPFGVDVVLARVILGDRGEGIQPDVQGQAGETYPASP